MSRLISVAAAALLFTVASARADERVWVVNNWPGDIDLIPCSAWSKAADGTWVLQGAVKLGLGDFSTMSASRATPRPTSSTGPAARSEGTPGRPIFPAISVHVSAQPRAGSAGEQSGLGGGPPDIKSRPYSVGASMSMTLAINGEAHEIDVAPDTPLLWALRDVIGLTGTKFGCGMRSMRRMHGADRRRCGPLLSVAGRRDRRPQDHHHRGDRRRRRPDARSRRHGLISKSCNAAIASPGRSCPPPRSWRRRRNPADADIDAAMAGNICRCGTYVRIRAAIKEAAALSWIGAPRMISAPSTAVLTRRMALKVTAAAGGALILGSRRIPRRGGAFAAETAGDFAPNAFIRISRDGRRHVYDAAGRDGTGHLYRAIDDPRRGTRRPVSIR